MALSVIYWVEVMVTVIDRHIIQSSNVGKNQLRSNGNPLKTPYLSRFYARTWPSMELQVISWAEKIILVIFYKFLLYISSNQLSIARFLADLVHFNRPGLPVDRFSSAQKFFFTKTNNVKGVSLHQRESHCCLKSPEFGLQENSVFRPKIVRASRSTLSTLSKCPNIESTFYWDQYHSFQTSSLSQATSKSHN
jgi:hypothetical protein